MIALTPASLLAADSGAAMLYGRGPVSLNGSPLPQSSAVFPGDLIQTLPESLATLDASGSGVVVLPDSLVKFEGKAVTLEPWDLAALSQGGGHIRRLGAASAAASTSVFLATLSV